MKKAVFFLCVLMTWATGYSQTLSLKFGTPFRHPNLDVRWKVPTNALPSHAWVYEMLPNHFAQEGISNLITLGRFTEKEKTKSDNNWLIYKTPDDSRRLGILFPLGSLEYEIRETHGPTNLVRAVPSEDEALKMTTNWLSQLGINVSDIERKDGSAEPNFHCFDSETVYFVNRATITNTEFRGVRFRRSVDGFSCIGGSTGGNCEFQFGDHGKLSKMSLSWRNIKRHKDCPVVDPETIIKWIRTGKAVQGMIVMDTEPINWRTVTSVTVNRAELCYYGGGPFEPSNWLMPFAALWTTVDTGHGTVDVEIDCPIIEQIKPSVTKQ